MSNSETMRAWQLANTGPITQTLRLNESAPRPSASLKPGQVLVRVAAAGLNPADYKPAELGALGRAIVSFPRTMAMDLAGRVEAAAADVTDVQPGDAIMGRLNPVKTAEGALSEYVVLDKEGYTKLPADADLDQAAGAGTAALTALQAMAPHVAPGDRIFVNGGSGGVGTFCIQIGKLLGCHVTTTCSGAKAERCRALGADEVVDYTTTDLRAHLRAAGPTYALFVDNVGSDFAALYAMGHEFLTPTGHFTIIGLPIGFGAVGSVLAASLRPAWLGGGRRKIGVFVTRPSAADMARVAAWMAEGRLQTVVDSTFGFGEVQEAYERLKGGRCHGKVVVRVADKS